MPVSSFGAHPIQVIIIIQSFRSNRDLIEKIASEKYNTRGRAGPVVLRRHDFVGRIAPPSVH